MPPGEQDGNDALRRKMREAAAVGTALERSYSEAKIAAVNMLDAIRREGDSTFDDLREKIVDSVTDGSKEASENLLSSLTGAVSRAPDELRPIFDKIAAMAAKSAAASGSAPGYLTRYHTTKSRTVDVVAGQSRMLEAARMAATDAGLKGEAHASFVGKTVYGSQTAGSLVDIQNKKDYAASSLKGAELASAIAGLDARKNAIVEKELRSKAEQISYEAKTSEKNKTLATALAKPGFGGSLLRSALDSKGPMGQYLRDRAEKESNTVDAGKRVGFGDNVTNTAISNFAGVLDALEPLEMSIGAIGGLVQVLIAGFDRARAVGTASFIALSSKGQSVGTDFAAMGLALRDATSGQNSKAAWNGVNLDTMRIASLGAMTRMSQGIPKTDSGFSGMVDALDTIQETGTLAGLSIEESLHLGSRAADAFNLKSGPKMLDFFKHLDSGAQHAGLNLRDFAAGFGDMTALAQKFGDGAGLGFDALAASMAHAAGPGPADKMLGMGIAHDIAQTPYETRLGLHMAASGSNVGSAAAFLEAGKMTPAQTLEDAMRIAKQKGLSASDPLERAKLLEFVKGTGLVSQARMEGMVTRPDLTEKMFSGAFNSSTVLKELDDAVRKNPHQPETALEYMGAQQGALEQLVGIARELLMWLTGSTMFSAMVGNEAGRKSAAAFAGQGNGSRVSSSRASVTPVR